MSSPFQKSGSGMKTYSHLAGGRRLPSDYELATSRLLYYTKRGFEVALPLEQWYAQYQKGSPLQCADWERFVDPRETTYTTYTALAHEKEIFVDGLLRSIDEQRYDEQLSSAWRSTLERVLPTARYLFHGLHMLAAYIAQMAPSGRITIAAMFQAADELRRTQRAAYRMRQLQTYFPSFGENSRSTWQHDPMWQPLRESVERLLVTYDFGEALVALNLCLKPQVDDLLLHHFGALGSAHQDGLLSQFLFSLYEDCLWHRKWTQALLRMVVTLEPRNLEVIAAWLHKWQPLVHRATAAFAPLWGDKWVGGALESAQQLLLAELGPPGWLTAQRVASHQEKQAEVP